MGRINVGYDSEKRMWAFIERFDSKGAISREDTVMFDLINLEALYKETIKELISQFTYKEMIHLLVALNGGHYVDQSISPKAVNFLFFDIFRCDGDWVDFSLDALKNLNQKVVSMTLMQKYTLLELSKRLWTSNGFTVDEKMELIGLGKVVLESDE